MKYEVRVVRRFFKRQVAHFQSEASIRGLLLLSHGKSVEGRCGEARGEGSQGVTSMNRAAAHLWA